MAGVKIGLDKLHYALLTTDPAGGTATYGAPKPILGAISAKVSPSSSTEVLYADDQAAEIATSQGEISIELNTKDLTAEQLKDLLGATINSEGVLIQSKDDEAPYVAIGFRSKKSRGGYRYNWYFKGKFHLPDEEAQTKEASATFSTPTISGTFLPRESDGQWRARVDSDDTGIAAGVIANWFTEVYEATPTP